MITPNYYRKFANVCLKLINPLVKLMERCDDNNDNDVEKGGEERKIDKI